MLRKELLSYAETEGIESGTIIRTRRGNPIDRSNIWKILKRLAEKSGVDREKVFPHNLRKLFAREFYETRKDIVKLADVLGHSSINTTRIYLRTTGKEHRKIIESLKLVR